MRRALVALCIAGGLNAVSVAAAQNPAQPALPPATMAGVVRDSTGAPIADAEVVVREMTQGTRTNARGEFTLRDVSPGAYQVWFRRLGYRSIDYNWDARPGERTEVTVVLHAIPRTLDPVVVRAEEDRRLKGSSSILGIVVDSAGTPIEEAEVQLVGANRLGVTRPNGGFLFRPLPVGQYLIRVRKLGYVPTNMTLNLVDHDDREVIIKMRGLPVKLDAMVIAERSGYAPDDHALEDLDKRLRWQSSFRTVVAGRDQLEKFGTMGMDQAMAALGGAGAIQVGERMAQAKIQPRFGPREPMAKTAFPDACILLNGKTQLHQPLATFSAAQVEMLEVYPPQTEITGTVADKMRSPECRAVSLFEHPTYFVIWLRSSR
jgi:hypothetical protein